MMKNKTGKSLIYIGAICVLLSFVYFLMANIRLNFADAMLKNDFIQCSAMLLIFSLTILIMAFKINISNAVIFSGLFMVLAHFLFGEVLNFYVIIPHYDTILHVINNMLITLIVFSIIENFNPEKRTRKGQILLRILSVLGIAVLIGVVWEILEFTFDGIFGLNMQRFFDAKNGVPFVGRNALMDTMKDLITDIVGELLACIIYYALSIKNKAINNIFKAEFKKSKKENNNHTKFDTAEEIDITNKTDEKKENGNA